MWALYCNKLMARERTRCMSNVHFFMRQKNEAESVIMIDMDRRREFQSKQCHATSGQLNKVMSSCQLKNIIPLNKCQFLTNVCIRMIFISHVPVIRDPLGTDTFNLTAQAIWHISDLNHILRLFLLTLSSDTECSNCSENDHTDGNCRLILNLWCIYIEFDFNRHK